MRAFAAGLFVSLACTALSQSPAPAFEVASVKPADPVKSLFYVPMETGPERFSAFGFTLDYLIQWSYGLRDFQVSGGPGWLKSENFDIEAKVDAPASLDQIKLMVQTLLADRLQLKLHRESKELSVYVLTVGRDGPKLGSGYVGESRDVGRGLIQIDNSRGSLLARATTMGLLAEQLSNMLDRPVLDQTELHRGYDFTLPYDGGAVGQEDGRGAERTDAIFSAIQDLGLKLDPQKLPVEFLVIDSVQHPSEN